MIAFNFNDRLMGFSWLEITVSFDTNNRLDFAGTEFLNRYSKT